MVAIGPTSVRCHLCGDGRPGTAPPSGWRERDCFLHVGTRAAVAGGDTSRQTCAILMLFSCLCVLVASIGFSVSFFLFAKLLYELVLEELHANANRLVHVRAISNCS